MSDPRSPDPMRKRCWNANGGVLRPAGGGVPEPRFRILLSPNDVGNRLFPTILRTLPTPCSGSRAMENLTKEFERRVTAFLRRTGLSASEFGERAVGDRKFVGDVRRGRSPRLATADRVLAFMAAYEHARRPDGSRDSKTKQGRRRVRRPPTPPGKGRKR